MGVSSFDTIALAVATGIVAKAGGGKTGAPFLTTGSNGSGGQKGVIVVSTVATAADSVQLPRTRGDSPSVPVGTSLLVVNDGASSMQVFGADTDTINKVATGTGVAQAAGISAMYTLVAPGDWRRNLSA